MECRCGLVNGLIFKAMTLPNNFLALGRRPKTDGASRMNKTEAEYASILEAKKRAGEILWYAFEYQKLRLADNTFYSVDFTVLTTSGQLQCHEVKGAFVQDDARVKFKVAAEQAPFAFVWAQKTRAGWCVENY